MNNEMENEVYEEEDRIFEVEAEDGTIEKLYHIATVEYKGGMYCCFQKAEPESEEEEDKVIIFALKGEGEDAMLEPIEDEDVLDGVFEDGVFVLYTQSETAFRSLTREDHYALIAQAFAAIGMSEGSFEIRLRGKKADVFNKAVDEIKATFNGVKVDVR